MPVTSKQQQELANMARRANRRLERATEGQRSYLEYKIKKYHTRERESGARVFQQGKAQSTAEYNARMRELRRFLGLDENNEPKTQTVIDPETGEEIEIESRISSTRKGWEAIKADQIAEAGKTLRDKQNYNITDEELAVVLQELGEQHKSVDLYKALDNVELVKQSAGDDWDASPDMIRDAMYDRLSAQQRVEALLDLRSGG